MDSVPREMRVVEHRGLRAILFMIKEVKNADPFSQYRFLYYFNCFKILENNRAQFIGRLIYLGSVFEDMKKHIAPFVKEKNLCSIVEV